MKAVIMAGGEGTRLRPLTRTTPKPLVPVGHRRCIDYSLSSLERAGITEIIVTTSYKADMIVDAIEATDVSGLSVLFSFEREPLGTAGGVAKNRAFLDETFLVLSADVLADVDLGAMVSYHREKGAEATMALTTTDKVSEYGIVGLDADGRIERFKEKPRPEEAFSNLINAGIYVLEPQALDQVPVDTKFDFSRDLFPRLLDGGRPMFGHQLDGLWMDIGRPSDLIAANKAVVERAGGDAARNGVQGPVWISEGAGLGPGATVEGPAMVADGVEVEEGAHIARSFLHPGVRVGAEAVVEDCIVLPGCTLGAHSRLVRTILDEGCSVGQGAQLTDTMVGAGTTVGVRALHENAVLEDPA
jgi:mannose-1-phosphate guanylyltransferase